MRLRLASLPLLAVLLGATPPPEGVFYVLVHFQDESSVEPERWHWEDRVWEIHQRGEDLVWTAYEIVSFMDVRGRFENPGTPLARRLGGPWEPNASQLREIERGLFVNPRGARTLALERTDGGWRTRVAASDRVIRAHTLSFSRSGAITFDGDLPVFVREETLLLPERDPAVARSVFRVTGRDGNVLTGRLEAEDRSGRFRLWPTRLRRRLRPEAGRSPSGLVLKPDATAQWQNLVPALLRPWRYLPERRVEIESDPPGAFLDLAYLRDGARRMFEQGRAPLAVRLPSRLVAHSSDVLQIRASAAGFESTVRDVRLHGDEETVRVALVPVPNRLLEVWYRPLAGRASLVLFAREPLRLRASRGPEGLTLVLPGTALGAGTGPRLESLHFDPLRGARPLQLADDLVIRLRLAPGVPERLPVRTREDPLHAVSETWLELPPADPAAWRERVEGALAALDPAVLDGCGLAFEDALRRRLPADATAQALARAAPWQREVLEALLRRIAGPPARLMLDDGSALRTDRPRQLAMALVQPERVVGLVAAVRAVANALGGADAEREILGGWLAPQLPRAEFGERLALAREAESRCRAGAASSSSS